MKHNWRVSGIAAAATKAGCETGTHQDRSKDFLFSLACSREEMHKVKGRWRAAELDRGIGQKKKAFAVGGGVRRAPLAR